MEFVSRENRPISRQEWNALQADALYRLVAGYEHHTDPNLAVVTVWEGLWPSVYRTQTHAGGASIEFGTATNEDEALKVHQLAITSVGLNARIA